MGVIKKQAIKGAIWSYLGIGIGFLNMAILFTHFLTTEQVGLTQVLTSLAMIIGSLGSLGFNNVTLLLFPHYRSEQNHHNGFGFLMVVFIVAGSILALSITRIFQTYLIQSNFDTSPLFGEYFNYLYPFIFFWLAFAVFDNYNNMLYDSAWGSFLKQFLLRIFITILISSFALGIIGFRFFMMGYISSYGLILILMLAKLLINKKLNIMPRSLQITIKLKRKIIDIALFGIIVSVSGMVIQNVDKYMVYQLIDLNAAGIYSISFFFGSLILIPQQAISKISSPVLSEAWKRADMKDISDVYSKSSFNQFLIGVLIFIGVWANIGNVFKILPVAYESGKWVIFFIAISCLITTIGGGAGNLISTSKYYRVQTWFMFLLVFLVILTNIILIPIWGITGAAIASLFSILIFNLFRAFFVYYKFKIHPLSINHLYISIIAISTYLISTFIPVLENFYIDILIRSSVITFIFVFLVLRLKLSEELNAFFKIIKERIQ